MDPAHLKIAFVRRGFSSSGGAEAYLKRLGEGIGAAGHEAQLITTEEWPPNEWSYGPITRVKDASPIQFADEVEQLRPSFGCDVLMSLERIWRCDVYRAGDGVHRSWLDRRAKFSGAMQKIATALNGKHRAILRLEKALLAEGGAARVIANSKMVQHEITAFYGYSPEQINVVYNGVPVKLFRTADAERALSRAALGLSANDIAVLFVGSGWERKGLRFAVDAVESCANPQMQLLVAGRGTEAKYRSSSVRFLKVVHDLPQLYAAADIFLLPTIYDPFSNACLEALATGLPVITTRANGFSEIIQDGTHGSIIEDPADIMAISSALQLWSDSARRAQARTHTIELAARYDSARNVSETLAILLQAAANAAATSGKIRKT
jgi:UDP-glucose:(heptosyl)LPS alpha-1,3-glucosyltransferase